MISFQYVVTDPEGVHARPAGLLVREAGKYQSSILLRKGEKSGDAKRIFAVMGMGVKQGDQLTIEISGEDEKKAAEEICAFLTNNL